MFMTHDFEATDLALKSGVIDIGSGIMGSLRALTQFKPLGLFLGFPANLSAGAALTDLSIVMPV